MTIHVPADQATIQAAINAANNGDTVLVSDGTYTENIDFNGKAITLTSVNGPSTTTIDGGAVDTVVSFRTGEGPGSVLNGFTIQNGYSNFSKPNFGDGGGVYIKNASPTVTNNVITNNKGCEGTGIFTTNSGSLIQGNTISNNSQSGCSGGVGGGGIAVLGSAGLRITGNVIANNSMPVAGGADGGGIALFGAGAPLIQGNTFTGNNAVAGGGISILNNASPEIVNNLFVHNTATNGGGLWWDIPTSTPGIRLVNNTIVNNPANQGSGVFADGFDSNAVFQNNVIVGASGFIAAYCGNSGNTVPPNFAANDVFTTVATPYGGICTDQTGINGNISTDPVFVDPAVDNYHLQPASPAIDAGNNSTPFPLPATDFDGNPRVVNTTVDIGAFEFQGSTTTTYSSTSLGFVPQAVGTTSPSQSITVTNTGSTAMQIIPFTITGDFAETDNCHTSSGIAAGQGCTIKVTFTPTAQLLRTGQLTITSNDAASPTIIDLSGDGMSGAAGLSTTTLTFTSQLVGTTSSSQPVTLSNTGTSSLGIDSILASGDFGQTNNCGSSVGASSSCVINVTFMPTVRGTRTGAVTIKDSAAGSPHVIGLQGSGIGPAATLSPGLTFTSQLVGTTSASQTVTLSSTGEIGLNINNISVSGDFGETNTCPNPLPNGQSCNIQVTFAPTARGARPGTLSVADNSTTSPEQVSLTGTGVAPVAALSQTSQLFGNQVLNVPVSSPVTLSNTGDWAMAINSIAAGGDFSQSNNCGTSLAPQTNCTITITFQPSVLGARSASLAIQDSASGSPHSVSLSGTGVQLGLSSASLAFGNQLSGTTSAVQTVTVTNSGNSALNITGIVSSAGFTETNNCGTTLAGSSACTINETFAPTAAGPFNGQVTISYNGTNSLIALSGNGTDFSLAAQPGNSTTATVAAGGTATYDLSASATSGFSGPVTFSCSGAPEGAACSVNPASVTLNGTTPENFTVTVTTTARSSALPVGGNLPRLPPIRPELASWGAAIVVALVLLRNARPKRLRYAGLAGSLAVLALLAGCGGGGSTPQHAPGTPAGASIITVTATFGSTSRTLNLTLNVN